MDTTSEYLTVAEVAEHLRITERHVRSLIASGELPAFRVGAKSIRIRREDVAKLVRPVKVAA